MNIRTILMVFICLLSGGKIIAQISYGGKPLFLDTSSLNGSSLLKNAETIGFITMPAFDVDSVRRADAMNSENMRGGFPFAYKFYTHIERGKDGNEWTLADGTRVWQVGIHSQGAYSLNLLFTEYHVPEGAKLFLYNADHSYIIGAFDHRNNSPAGILPVRPIAGESIIVEYCEPAGVAFAGRLTIGQVNHDYCDILRSEPASDPTDGTFNCMPDVWCHEGVDETAIRSTLLMMVNGTLRCSATLLNNTANDGTPYVLTAIHCLNQPQGNVLVKKDWEYYEGMAQTIVLFFNYNRPVCGTLLKATEELSMAMAYPRAIIERKDIALLELHEKPPPYYNACYAGWNANVNTILTTKPYTSIHHPQGAVKKYGFYDGDLSWITYDAPRCFDDDSHLKMEKWTIGSTDGGSSGSPLFDANYRVVGGLTGGWSKCGTPKPQGTHDYFFALEQGWETDDPNNQLKTFLDPWNSGVLYMDGMDPNRNNPLVRIGNAQYNDGDELITTKYTSPNSGFVFGNSNLDIVEFAEEFNPAEEIELYGAYLLIPPMPVSYTRDVEIRVYVGDSHPEQLIATQNLKPQFLNYSKGELDLYDKEMNVTGGTENFVLFDEPLKINSKFFIAYRIDNAPGAAFAVYNSKLLPEKLNSTWMNRNGVWIRSSAYDTQRTITSLAIQALSTYTDYDGPEPEKRTRIQYIRSENRLNLPETNLEAGQVYVYTVSGQLLLRIPIVEGQDVVTLPSFCDGTVGIVRVIRGELKRDFIIYTGKLIY